MQEGELLRREAVAARVGAGSKRAALGAVAEIASRSLGQPAQQLLFALQEREKHGSTGIGQGVAVPHAQVAGLKHPVGVFIKLETPVPFDAVDDRPVDLIFALFAPPEAGVDHLRALARVSRLLRQGELREQLRQARTADAMFALLSRDATSNAA
jgi:PTS system nitrogen regulatory IIA component